MRCWAGVKELVLHALTGELLVDHGTASGTGLRNLRTENWDEEALALAGLSAERLPRLVDGNRTVPLTADVGLPAGTPVVVGGADGPLANLGLGAIRPGDVACSIGTTGAVRAAVDEPWVDPAGRTFCYVLAPGRWVAGGATNSGGIVLEWLREAVAPDLGTPEAVLDAAAQAPPGSDGLLFLPHIVGSGRRSGSGAPAAPTSASRARTGAPTCSAPRSRARACSSRSCWRRSSPPRDRCARRAGSPAATSGARSSPPRSTGPSASPPPRRARGSAPRCSA